VSDVRVMANRERPPCRVCLWSRESARCDFSNRTQPPLIVLCYSLEEINLMLELLPEPASTIVMAAAFTGARKGEVSRRDFT
jgi:hypothetical protein